MRSPTWALLPSGLNNQRLMLSICYHLLPVGVDVVRSVGGIRPMSKASTPGSRSGRWTADGSGSGMATMPMTPPASAAKPLSLDEKKEIIQTDHFQASYHTHYVVAQPTSFCIAYMYVLYCTCTILIMYQTMSVCWSCILLFAAGWVDGSHMVTITRIYTCLL